MRQLIPTAALALLLFSGRALADEVFVRTASGAELKQTGTISQDDSEGLALRIAGGQGEQVFRPHEVIRAKVKYECLQRHYETGRGYENAKEYDLAIGKYEDAVKDAAVPKFARQYAWLRMAKCYEKLNEMEKAAGSYKKLVEEMPKTAFLRDVAEGQFNCYVRLNKWDEASKSLAILRAQGEDGAFLASVFDAELLERKAERKEGEYSKAAEAYRAVAKKQPAPEVLCKAHAGTARCMLLDGQAAEAAEFAKKALAVKGCTSTAAADAHQVIGESLLAGLPEKAADLAQEKNRERALDAIEEMMRPVLQYRGSPWAEERAYYFVGLWAGRLGGAAVGPEWAGREAWAFKELRAKFPNGAMVKQLKDAK
ncbi:MAG TPA: tetratricopeptide repeat protein [Planctomycetota bacterium]|nr:tetratricopeptide repeat protein [Planctomycetota bacterium]